MTTEADLRDAERLRETGDAGARARVKILRERLGLPQECPDIFDHYDWREVFGVAGEPFWIPRPTNSPSVVATATEPHSCQPHPL